MSRAKAWEAIASRRVWSSADRMRVAYYAEQGRSAEEIAALVGATTPDRIRKILGAACVPLVRRSKGWSVLFFRCKNADREALDRAALKHGSDPADLPSQIIGSVLQQGDEALDRVLSSRGDAS